MRLSLSRKHGGSASHGVTRKELLQERLGGVLRTGDLVIYLDEWLTGANFAGISEHIARMVRRVKGASFLPVGMLKNDSCSDKHYRTRVKEHNKVLERFGFGSGGTSRFRPEFPPVGKIGPVPGHFFWADRQGIAGYRKKQLLRLTFETLDASVEALVKSRDLWPEAITLFLAEIAKSRAEGDNRRADFPWEVLEDPDACMKLSYHDYRRVRSQLKAIWDPSNRGQCDDPDRTLKALGRRIMAMVMDRPARICVGLGLKLTEGDFVRSTRREKEFDEHAPVLGELRPPGRWFHDRLLERIVAAIET